jgi:hypothetical protein
VGMKQSIWGEKMFKAIKFGEKVEGYQVPVLNEREIRASAGILFLLMFTSWMLIIFNQNYVLAKYVISIFFIDFVIRILVNPKYSPTMILGRLIVGKQTPEYVGAPQKQFAWIIGLTLSTAMFIHMVVLNAASPITGLVCWICMIFTFFESVFGICLGCIFYRKIFKKQAQYCPGEICEIKARQAIQKTSLMQVGILIGFAVLIIVMAVVLNDQLSLRPTDLWITA